jgi:hypothetical protein
MFGGMVGRRPFFATCDSCKKTERPRNQGNDVCAEEDLNDDLEVVLKLRIIGVWGLIPAWGAGKDHHHHHHHHLIIRPAKRTTRNEMNAEGRASVRFSSPHL